MAKIYTDDLIRFIYNETSAEESNEISIALLSNTNLLNEYESLKDTVLQLDSINLLPSKTSIDIIMEESHRQLLHMAH